MTHEITPAGQIENGPVATERLQLLAQMILAFRNPNSPLSSIIIPVLKDPIQVEADLTGTKAGCMLLAEGESFGIQDPSGYYEDLKMRAGEYPPRSASIKANHQKFNDGSSITTVETFLSYASADEQASQSILIESITGYEHPKIYRKLFSIAYAETGYEGHGVEEMKDATPKDIHEVIDLIAPLVVDFADKRQEFKQTQQASGNL